MKLFDDLSAHGIHLRGALPLADCQVRRPDLLVRAGFAEHELSDLSVLLFAVPYLTPESDRPDRNLSSYAVAEDYHLYLRELFDELLPAWRKAFPGHRFAGFADHSPIDEIEAAVRAGFGIRGLNHLLLTVRHSSYIFLGEVITDLALPFTATTLPESSLHCHACGACQRACPMTAEGGPCRSALTQKKGELTEKERAMLSRHSLVWGCDLCQEVCPYTTAARMRGTLYTEIPFFYERLTPRLTLAQIDAMDDATFSRRAYAWRGRPTLRRNLLLKQDQDKED